MAGKKLTAKAEALNSGMRKNPPKGAKKAGLINTIEQYRPKPKPKPSAKVTSKRGPGGARAS